MLTIKRILKEINDPRIDIWRNHEYGYHVIVFEEGRTHETESVLVYRLNHLTLEEWVETIRSFIKTVQQGDSYEKGKPDC